jgi:autotransporter-associated beta strand protein
MMGSTSPLLSQTLYWDGSDTANLQAGAGTWSIGSSLWSTSTNPAASTRVPWTNGSDADFVTSGTSAVTVSGTVDVNSITFTGTGYTIGGTALTLTGTGGNITTTSAGAISAPITGGVGLTKLGTDTLTLSGDYTYTGLTTV